LTKTEPLIEAKQTADLEHSSRSYTHINTCVYTHAPSCTSLQQHLNVHAQKQTQACRTPVLAVSFTIWTYAHMLQHVSPCKHDNE